jgi:hypothetical protein
MAALDWPASPTVGQQYSGGGVSWTFDGVKWTASGLSPGFLPLIGGALTGDLSISGPDANTLSLAAAGTNWPGVRFTIASGKGAWIGSYVGATERWEIDLGNGIAESGSNAGSNFQIARYSDTGVFIDDPIVINRANGSVYLSQSLVAPNVVGANRLDNGDMRIDQRNGSGRNVSGSAWVCDRWYYFGTAAGMIQWTQIAATGAPLNAGFPYCMNFKSLSAHTIAAADQYFLYTAIEADRMSDFRWGTAQAQPVTLSFWAESSKTGSFSGSLQNYAGTRSYPFSFSLPTANTWTQISITIPGDTAGTWILSGNAGALLLNFDLGCGSTYKHAAGAWAAGNYYGVTGGQTIVNTNNATYNITAVKLEIGSVATAWQRKTLAESLTDCQRYYESCGSPQVPMGIGSVTAFTYIGAVVAYAGTFMPFATTKRAAPSVTMHSTATGAAGMLSDSNSSVDVTCYIQVMNAGFMYYANGANPAAYINFQGYWEASADI